MDTQIGIHAPYAHNDTTAMACALGELSIELRGSTSYLAYQSISDNVHFRWDKEVRSVNRTSFKQWAETRDLIIWFDVQPKKLKMVRNAKNVLVPMWHSMSLPQLATLNQFSAIVCPHESAYKLLCRTRTTDLQLAEWSQCYREQSRPRGTHEPGKFRILVSLNGASICRFGDTLLPALRLLVDVMPDVYVTIMHTKRWPKSLAEQAKTLVGISDGRVSMLYKPNYLRRIEALKTHDWLFCSSVSADAGWDATEALSLGMPVLCFDVAPYRDIVRNGHNGIKIPCNIERTEFGAEIAQPNSAETLEALSIIAGDVGLLTELQGTDWPDIEHRTRHFQSVWRKLLG